MIPGTIVNQAMYRGADRAIPMTVYGPDNITPAVITGWAITFTLYAYGDPSTVFLTKTVGAGITITDGPNGALQVAFLAADTANFRPGQYEYSVTRTDVLSVTPSAIAGLFTLLGSADSPN